jgi:hypothetical protein
MLRQLFYFERKLLRKRCDGGATSHFKRSMGTPLGDKSAT